MSSKSVRVKGVGKLEVVTETRAKASTGNVVVHLTLRPVNPSDILMYTVLADTGHIAAFRSRHVLGIEGAGYVEEVGEGVSKVRVGQRVVPFLLKKSYLQGNGSWQEYIEVSEDEVFIPPDSLSDEIACQSVVNPWTAYGLLLDQNVPKGDWLIQTAAASQLGRQVIQLAKHYGFKTINVVRRDDVIDELKALGADVVINSSKEDILEKVKEVTGGKLAFGGLDAVAGDVTKLVAASVRDGGKIFVYGLLSGTDVTVAFSDLSRVQLSFWILFQILPTLEATQEVAAEVFRLLDVTPQPPIKRFSFENFEQAIELSQKGSRGGKVLLES